MTLVQANYAQAASGVAGSPLSANATIGNTVALMVLSVNAGDTVSSMTSTMGTPVSQGSYNAASVTVSFWTIAVTSAAKSVTPTMSSGDSWTVVASEWTGGYTFAFSNGTSGFSASPTCAVTPAASGQVALAGLNTNTVQFTAYPTSPWTSIMSPLTNFNGFDCAYIASTTSTSTQTATWSLGSTPGWATASLLMTPVVIHGAYAPTMGWLAVLNSLAGTKNLGENLAANIYAYGSDHHNGLLQALNDKAGTKGLGLDAVCNSIAGTTGLSALNALNQKNGT